MPLVISNANRTDSCQPQRFTVLTGIGRTTGRVEQVAKKRVVDGNRAAALPYDLMCESAVKAEPSQIGGDKLKYFGPGLSLRFLATFQGYESSSSVAEPNRQGCTLGFWSIFLAQRPSRLYGEGLAAVSVRALASSAEGRLTRVEGMLAEGATSVPGGSGDRVWAVEAGVRQLAAQYGGGAGAGATTASATTGGGGRDAVAGGAGAR
ncbi:hypothetical protein B0H19DRAFT_1077124 [Mycena capillaripes]|nr:hypothetical protein B0H19DRAFT_1077124 [Mycena capillaripes]